MLDTSTVSSPPGRSSLLRSILGLLIINVAIPFGCYILLKRHAPLAHDVSNNASHPRVSCHLYLSSFSAILYEVQMDILQR